jgi:hypothetical protein
MPKAGHGKQEAQQSVELLDPDDIVFVPAAHSMHVVAEEAPTIVEYVPAAQVEQELDAEFAEYLPAGHKRHVALVDAPTAVENFPE